MLFALASGMSIGNLLIWIVVIAACIAIVGVALHQFNVQIPPWVIHIGWILLVAVVAVFALRFVLTL